MGKVVINGSGISGLLCALLLCREGRGKDVVIVDKAAEPGGLLRRFNYGEWGDFDYGMHNMLETGIDDLDQLLFGLLPESEWQLLEKDKRDLAGIYFNGQLQKNTPYIDLRSLSDEDYNACRSSFLEHLEKGGDIPDEPKMTAYDYAVSRFGKTAAEKTVVPSLEKIHKKGATELDFMATVFTPMTRLAFCDDPIVRDFTETPLRRSRIAWSDQRTLPSEHSSGRRAFYPVRYGIHHVTDAIIQRITEAGATILTGTEIIGVESENGRVHAVKVCCKGKEETLDDLSRLIWTANIPMLGRFLGVDFAGLKYDKPLKTIIVNLVVDQLPAAMGDLYYFFCYQPGFHTYRLTNFSNYCHGAGRNGGFPVSIELLIEEEVARSSDLTEIAMDEFRRFGVGDPSTKFLFAKAELLESGFPMPSVNNIFALRSIRNAIHGMKLSNLDLVGILAEDNLFFQTDVLRDVYKKIN